MNTQLMQKVLGLAAQICHMHADLAGNRICQDWSGATTIIDALTEDERDELMQRYEQYNSNGADFEPGYFPYDEMLISYVIANELNVLLADIQASDF